VKIKTAAEDRLKWTALAFNLLQRKKKMSWSWQRYRCFKWLTRNVTVQDWYSAVNTSGAGEVLKLDNWFVNDRISTLEGLVLAAVVLCDNNSVSSGVMPIITGCAVAPACVNGDCPETGKWQNSTPHKIKTLKPIAKKMPRVIMWSTQPAVANLMQIGSWVLWGDYN